MKLGSMAGPLGSSQNYIFHIALSNCTDYFDLKMKHEEENRSSTSDKYKEFRYYLNSIESLNNIIDYFYFENESLISHSNIKAFRTAVNKKYPVLNKVADIANAYKHCVREQRSGNKNTNLLWAKDLQKPEITIDIDVPDMNVDVSFNFVWPIQEQEEVIELAWRFWVDYYNAPTPQEFISA
ncbi:TPA: hypothetical protein SIA32_003614 [Aeromonas sobria]|nr:hypothetical protein [Aeromonas sobria]